MFGTRRAAILGQAALAPSTLYNSGITRLFGTQSSNLGASIVSSGSGVGASWVTKVQVPGGAIGARLILYNTQVVAEIRSLKASIAMTEKGAIDTTDNAYSAWSGGTKHNAAAPGDPLGFKGFTWGGLSTSPVLPRTNPVLPCFGYMNQETYVVSDTVLGLTPVKATDRTKEEYYAILRMEWDLHVGDGISIISSGTVSSAISASTGSDRADYPLMLPGRVDPTDSVASPSTLPTSTSPANAPCCAIEWIYPAGTKAVTAWLVGDSITESYQWTTIGCWRNSTPARPIHTFNLGGSTTRTESFLGNMWSALQVLTRPDIVIIPSNSVNNYSPLSNFTMTEAQTVQWPRLKAACDALIGEGVKVIIWTNYNYSVDTDLTTPIGWLNDQVRQYVTANSGRAWLCDINRAPGFVRSNYNASTNPTGWIDPDGTHPSNPVGIAGMAAVLQPVVAQVVASFAS